MLYLDLDRLAADLADMRLGRGERRIELRRRLAAIDPRLRRERNIERLRLANAKAQLRMLDSRADPAPLLEAAKQSAARLAGLDLRIVEEIARGLSQRK